jgi:predicted RNase H-like HicB family nuclease
MRHEKLNKALEYYLSLPYTIELTPDEDGYWFAEIPLLEGCMTNGASQMDALDMIKDAKRAWLTTALELGLAIPEPEAQPLK